MYCNLSKEQRLVVLGSRLSLSDQIRQEIYALLQDKTVDYYEVFKLALYHKTLAICMENYNIIYTISLNQSRDC